jgi:hypothetical protein
LFPLSLSLEGWEQANHHEGLVWVLAAILFHVKIPTFLLIWGSSSINGVLRLYLTLFLHFYLPFCCGGRQKVLRIKGCSSPRSDSGQ